MKIPVRNIVPFTFVLLILLLVIVRSSTSNHFKSDARKYAQPSFGHAVILSDEQIGQITGNRLFIFLDEGTAINSKKSAQGEILIIPPADLLDKANLKKILNHKGIILLESEDPALSARIWMILSQMGRDNLFIVSDDEPEVLKYKFRPDSLIRPESIDL